MVMRSVLLRSLHSTSGIGSVKWHDMPLHSYGVVAVENDQREDRKQKESVVHARLDLNFRIFFSRSRVG